MAARAYNAVFTAETLEPRTSARGRPYIRARGVISNTTGEVRRTVLVRGPGYEDVVARLRIGEPLALRGFYERVQGPSGKGGQFFSAFGLANRRNRGDASSSRGSDAHGATTREDLNTRADGSADESNRDASRTDAGHPMRIVHARDPLDEGPSVPAGPVTTRSKRRRAGRRQAMPMDDAAIAMLLAPHERPAMPSVAELEARAMEQNARQPDLIDGGGHGPRGETAQDAPLRTIGGHLREGYWRRQRHGPGRSLVKTVYIGRSAVNGGPKTDAPSEPKTDDPDMLPL